MQESVALADADIVIAGGVAGPGKTAQLLMDPVRHTERPGFTALILRKSLNDLEQAGGLWDKSRSLYPPLGAEPITREYKWRFPSGATIQFGYVNTRTYEADYQGAEAAYLAFDELTHFTRSEFIYLFQRNRTSCGIRAYTRATCNPDADSWVRTFVDWWIGPDGLPVPDRAGKVRYALGRAGKWEWGDTAKDLLVRYPGARRGHIFSVTFVPGKLDENRFLGEDYEARLLAQEAHVQARLHEGNWDVRSEVGRTFRREWLVDRIVASAPDGTRWVRAWDLAATAERDAVSGTSCTAGVLLGMHEERRGGEVLSRRFYVGHAVIGRWDAGDVRQQVLTTAQDDGPDVPIWFCRERAGAGKAVHGHYVQLLAGYEVDGDVESGEKMTRLGPVAAQAKAGNLYIVKGSWNEEFLRHLYRLPDRPDDVGDALAAAFDRLALRDDFDGERFGRAYVELQEAVRGDEGGGWDFSGARGLRGF